MGNMNFTTDAESSLLNLRQGGRSLVDYVVEFIDSSHQVGWGDFALNLCFEGGLDRDIIRPHGCLEAALLDYTNVVLCLNGVDFEVEDMTTSSLPGPAVKPTTTRLPESATTESTGRSKRRPETVTVPEAAGAPSDSRPAGAPSLCFYRSDLLVSNIYSGYSEDFPKPILTVEPQSSLFTGDTLTLRCELDQSWDGWEFLRIKDSNTESTDDETKIINVVEVSDGGVYKCRARRRGRYTDYSEPVTVTIHERPKPRVSIKPDHHVFRGETVTLRCDIDDEGITNWKYYWYKGRSTSLVSERQELTFRSVSESDAGKYSCYGTETEGSRRSKHSDEVTLIISDKAQTVLSVSPQKWLTEGDPVNLICEVNGSSTGWTFSWFTETLSSDRYKLLSDSSRGSGGKYTVSSVALKHTGVYVCAAERGNPAYKTTYSNTQPLWVSGVSPPVSLIIGPSRTQHFTSVSLSLSCEDQSNSDGWTVTRYTERRGLKDCSSYLWGSQTGSTCTIKSTIPSDTGVYWCHSESGEKYHPVNITVHSGVILESPVHPLTEGDNLTLRCLYQDINPSILRADFYKDGSLVQNQTTEMIIPAVSKSHEGFYNCKHPERGESPKSWISVRGSHSDSISIFIILCSALAACPYLLVTVVLIYKCCRIRDATSD